MERNLNQRKASKAWERWRTLARKPSLEIFGHRYCSKIANRFQRAHKVKPAAIVVMPRTNARIVVRLTVFAEVDAYRLK